MLLQGIAQIMENARKNMQDITFQQAGTVLNENKNIIREEIQKETSEEIKRIISKISSDNELTSQDLDMIELWIIGDAESYTRMENNIQDWLEEYKRLENIIRNYEGRECNVGDLVKLHGIMEDAIRVSYDIAYFLENKQRIERFESSVKNATSLDEEAREFLIGILSEKLGSSDY
ncbi:MAG: hypothetical protein ACMUHX_07805 [bacterium]